jgi:integrase
MATGAEVTNPSAATGMRRLESGDHTLKRPVRALTDDERTHLLAKIDIDERAVSRDLPDLFRFLMATGCRIGEALAVHWCDVDLDRDFRKTAATILDEQRFSAREIADVLGHSRPSLTQDVYMHRGAANPAAGAALNEALRPRTA